MVVGEIPEPVDLLIVGGGPGGYVAALRAAQLNRAVVLVERGGDAGIGGVCLNVGCIPSKALIELGHASHGLQVWAGKGIRASAEVDLDAWQTWRTHVVGELVSGIRTLLATAGVKVVHGELRFTRANQAVVETEGMARFYEFKDVIISSGSRPATMPGLAPNGREVLNSTDLLALRAVPAKLVIVGGGYIGVELGTAMAKLGAKVSIIESEDRILPALGTSLTGPVAARMRSLGIDVVTSAQIEDYDGEALKLRVKGETRHLDAGVILLATGRTPNTDDLGIEKLGVHPDERGFLPVEPDRRLTPHVAAIGDVTVGPAFAHKASAEALVAAEALSGLSAQFAPQAIPSAVFSDPEIASAGLSEDGARYAGVDVVVGTFPLRASGRAQILHQTRGHLQVVADRQDGSVVGVHAVGPHASDLINEGMLAIEMGATLEDLAATIHVHPTLGEQYPEGAHLALGRPIHVVPR